MPIVFTLTRHGEKTPTDLVQIDEEICAAFNVPCDPIKYYNGWYDWIGFRLALGYSYEKIETDLDEHLSRQTAPAVIVRYQRMKEILNFIQSNFTPYHWREIGKRK